MTLKNAKEMIDIAIVSEPFKRNNSRALQLETGENNDTNRSNNYNNSKNNNNNNTSNNSHQTTIDDYRRFLDGKMNGRNTFPVETVILLVMFSVCTIIYSSKYMMK